MSKTHTSETLEFDLGKFLENHKDEIKDTKPVVRVPYNVHSSRLVEVYIERDCFIVNIDTMEEVVSPGSLNHEITDHGIIVAGAAGKIMYDHKGKRIEFPDGMSPVSPKGYNSSMPQCMKHNIIPVGRDGSDKIQLLRMSDLKPLTPDAVPMDFDMSCHPEAGLLTLSGRSFDSMYFQYPSLEKFEAPAGIPANRGFSVYYKTFAVMGEQFGMEKLAEIAKYKREYGGAYVWDMKTGKILLQSDYVFVDNRNFITLDDSGLMRVFKHDRTKKPAITHEINPNKGFYPQGVNKCTEFHTADGRIIGYDLKTLQKLYEVSEESYNSIDWNNGEMKAYKKNGTYDLLDRNGAVVRSGVNPKKLDMRGAGYADGYKIFVNRIGNGR
ncbi:MAG: hypothetical protein LBH81_01435 [Rickettsiales bacterium]|nr:hypothetical protein [Rickettsiales bacterium]